MASYPTRLHSPRAAQMARWLVASLIALGTVMVVRLGSRLLRRCCDRDCVYRPWLGLIP
jgi:hypothetical protein